MNGTIAPGPTGRPLVGSLFDWRRTPAEFLLRLQRDHGEVVRMKLGPYLVHLVTEPEAVHRVLVGNHHNYDRGKLYDQFKLVMGTGLLTTDGPAWRSHRRAVQPLFLNRAIGAILPNVVESTHQMLDRWEVAATRGEPVDLIGEMLQLTLVTLSRSLFGYDPGAAVAEMKRTVDAGIELMFTHGLLSEQLPEWIPNARNRQIRATRRFFDRLVDDIRSNHHRTGQGQLVELMETARDPVDGRAWTDREIRDELLTVYLAGHETTAAAACWALYALSGHRWAAEELTAEVDQVLAGRAPTLADTERLTYTGQVIQEALRLYPPIWTFPRGVVADDELAGRHVPAGSSILISPLVSHRNPRIWDNPDAFDPARFAGDAARRLPRLSYLPFGGGPRMCVGNLMALLELKVIVALVSQRFQLQTVPGDFVRYGHSVISLRPQGRLLVTPKPRVGAAA
ncbi:cytochrome P450 [Micromonospora wenchangensis]